MKTYPSILNNVQPFCTFCNPQEGILDSLMYILSSFFRNYTAFLRNEPPVHETREPFQSFKPGGNAFFHARLAANCCVALGKAHCAAVHTEGDLVGSLAYISIIAHVTLIT
jgi:hypothetical protein